LITKLLIFCNLLLIIFILLNNFDLIKLNQSPCLLKYGEIVENDFYNKNVCKLIVKKVIKNDVTVFVSCSGMKIIEDTFKSENLKTTNQNILNLIEKYQEILKKQKENAEKYYNPNKNSFSL